MSSVVVWSRLCWDWKGTEFCKGIKPSKWIKKQVCSAGGEVHMSESKYLATLSNIIASPGEAFLHLREKPTFFVPLLAIVAANVIATMVYYNTVDFPWLIDFIIQSAEDSSNGSMTMEAQEAMRGALGSISPMVMGAGSAAGTAIVYLIMFCLSATYLVIISAISNDGFKFKNWLSLCSWCSIPTLFATVATVVNILLNDSGQIDPYAMNPVAFASLLDIDTTAFGAGGSMIAYLDITMLWSAVLMVLGYKLWTGRGTVLSAVIVLAPSILIIGCIVLFALI